MPLDCTIDAPDAGRRGPGRGVARRRRARSAQELDVEVKATTVRARAIGRAIVDHARDIGADLIVLGSSPRWRRQSRFFSPTVDFVLRQAPCEVLIVAFPQNVLDEELRSSAAAGTTS